MKVNAHQRKGIDALLKSMICHIQEGAWTEAANKLCALASYQSEEINQEARSTVDHYSGGEHYSGVGAPARTQIRSTLGRWLSKPSSDFFGIYCGTRKVCIDDVIDSLKILGWKGTVPPVVVTIDDGWFVITMADRHLSRYTTLAQACEEAMSLASEQQGIVLDLREFYGIIGGTL